MSAKQDGGQAFPSEFFETEHGDRVEAFAGSPGMTLRDWFAGQVMLGLCAYSGRAAGENALGTMRDRANNACAHADAMIAERSK